MPTERKLSDSPADDILLLYCNGAELAEIYYQSTLVFNSYAKKIHCMFHACKKNN